MIKTAAASITNAEASSPLRRKKIGHALWKNRALYLFLLPMTVYFLIFHYAPLYGLQIAFKDFKPAMGIAASPWVGLKYFEKFLSSYSFWGLLRNTLTISLYSLVMNFPIAIVLALVIHYTPFTRLRKLTQTATYAPHFVSTVVLVGMLFVFLAPSSGIVNNLLSSMGFETMDFMGASSTFSHLYVWSGVWQHAGWNSIIYIAALTGVPPELHEAATVDGATKLQRIRHVDIPAIMPTVIIMLIMDCGRIMNLGYEKILLMQASSNLGVSEIISTYVYKIGLQGAQYSYASAIGLFNNVINCILLLSVNHFANKHSGSGLW